MANVEKTYALYAMVKTTQVAYLNAHATPYLNLLHVACHQYQREFYSVTKCASRSYSLSLYMCINNTIT